MQNEAAILISALNWGAASRPLPGQRACGDFFLVKETPDVALLAVVDGLGHGPEAAAAAQRAVAALEGREDAPLDELVLRCHNALVQSRGVVMTLAALRPATDQLTWLGVGNVEAVLLPARGRSQSPDQALLLPKPEANDLRVETARPGSDHVLLRSGIVGYSLPELRVSVRPVAAGDLLVFYTDGIRPGFVQAISPGVEPQRLADRILKQHFKGTDDALVLVARYLGKRHE